MGDFINKMIKRLSIIAGFILLSLSLHGCGYNVGSIGHPQIKTIGIAPIVNETFYPDLSENMRQSLSERFQFDGSYKVKSVETSDCVLYGRVRDVKISAADIISANTGQIFRPKEWNINITFEFVVVIPGQAKPVISSKTLTGTAKYQVVTDQFVSRREGIRQACRNAAEQAVWACTEAW